jgi:small subunit ribosomal protein S6
VVEEEKRKAGNMAYYEHVLLARQDISSQQVEELVAHFKGILEERGGKVEKVENWGLKSLQFRINKNRKAHFALMNLETPADALHEMERQMRIHEDVLRFMTIRVDALEEGPSAMMRRGDRDDRPRGDRDDRPRRDRDDRPPRGDREDRPRRDDRNESRGGDA